MNERMIMCDKVLEENSTNPRICLEWLRKATEIASDDTKCLSQDLYQVHSK